MSSRRESQRLADISENIDAIDLYLAGMTFEAFAVDRKTIDASERCLERIIEATVKIGEDRMQEIAPAIPARSVRGLGNMLRHAYDDIDLTYIFTTIRRDLPTLRAACVAALKDLP
ncbi:hypothetical protein EBBID32_28200 [Sphingobium indicum BiD32]|uniref:DUF86 domain-containing protein n=1 Tax=Sphingobium indicum BiD32 TaxID=1301087 RepID=N1MS00_9SPHN|nr:HepT-like ribonuclease domain-containing protein [Sphingobium indicum]CCW18467.1 hypothetical protein EBBID32_28200 [Sphingobium indicum BiD32]